MIQYQLLVLSLLFSFSELSTGQNSHSKVTPKLNSSLTAFGSLGVTSISLPSYSSYNSDHTSSVKTVKTIGAGSYFESKNWFITCQFSIAIGKFTASDYQFNLHGFSSELGLGYQVYSTNKISITPALGLRLFHWQKNSYYPDSKEVLNAQIYTQQKLLMNVANWFLYKLNKYISAGFIIGYNFDLEKDKSWNQLGSSFSEKQKTRQSGIYGTLLIGLKIPL